MKNKIAVLANSTVMTAKKLVRKIREDKTFTLVKETKKQDNLLANLSVLKKSWNIKII